jgi:hypothetical protein
MAKSKAIAMHVFEVRMWSKEHFGEGLAGANVFRGKVIDKKTGKSKFFDTAGQLLVYLENTFKQHDKEMKKSHN